MRPIFDMALKPILRGLQHVLLRSGTLGRKTYCCGFLVFAIIGVIGVIGDIGDIVTGFKSLALDGL